MEAHSFAHAPREKEYTVPILTSSANGAQSEYELPQWGLANPTLIFFRSIPLIVRNNLLFFPIDKHPFHFLIERQLKCSLAYAQQ